MHLSAGPSQHSWRPAMTANTATVDYWWNWKVFVCAIWILLSMIVSSILIWKYEGSDAGGQENLETQQVPVGILYDDESWRPCLKELHPAWLLAFRVIAFFVLAILLTVYVIVEGGHTFYYYTQWTFALVTIYFGLGSLLSIYGCHQLHNKIDGGQAGHMSLDAERGTYVAPTSNQEANNPVSRTKRSSSLEEHQMRQIAGYWGYAFQIVYQTTAGAVMLTDTVFWLIIAPFLEMKDYNLNILTIGMHSVNAFFLLGDAAMNSLRFPWFRISYFLLWTAIYVFFQWIVHACISIWWPYPFLDLSSPYAPLWYLIVALMHIPCYAIYSLILKLKHYLLSKWFPRSYHAVK